jgi:hypothetical protein
LGASKRGAHFFVPRKQGQSGGTRRERITRLLAEVETKLKAKEMKVTLADFIRLTQLEMELEQEEQPREIIVTWKDAAEGHSDSK